MRGVRRNSLIRAAGAIHRVLQVLRCLLEAGHDVARVGAAKHDFDLRPCLGQPLHQQGQHRPGVFGPVDLSRAQVAHQQLVASEHIQGEKTVVVVVPVKEPADLLSVDTVVGGIEVQDQLPRRCLVGCDELLYQNRVQANHLVPTGPPLEPAQGRITGQGLVGAHRRLQRRVRPQFVVAVQVLVSQRQAENPLPELRPGRVPATGLAAWIVQNPRRLLGQSQHPIRLPQQHRAAVGSDRAAGKTGFHLASFTAWKTNKLWVTICHGQGLLRYRLN